MTEEQIFQEMLETFRQETGYEMRTTADLAVRLRAAAGQLMSLYHYGDYVFRQAFPQTAEGEYLDHHGALRGALRQEGARARGLLTFGISRALEEDLTVPAGTLCLTAGGTAFETLVEVSLAAGNLTTMVDARAVEPGTAGNVLPGAVTRMQMRPDGIETVTNETAFSGGRDRESDDAYRKRLLEVYRGLGNGANMGYYQSLALSVEGVDYARVIPCIDGAGTVGILVGAEDGEVPRTSLNALEALLEERKEFGISITVSNPETVRVTVGAKLQPVEGITFAEAKAATQEALENHFRGDRLGRSVYRAEIIAVAMATGKLQNILLTMPEADIAVEPLQQPVLSEVKLGGI